MNGIQTTVTMNSYGSISDLMRLRKESREKDEFKPTLSQKTVYYSTDIFIHSEFIDASKISKGLNSSKKVSNIEASNQIDFRSGKPIKLGEYNGETIEIRDYSAFGGIIDSSLAIPDLLVSKPGQQQNSIEKRASELASKLTSSQIAEISSISWAFNTFAKVAEGKMAIQSVPENMHKAVKLGLEKMGVDLSKPFAINGEEFYIRGDSGKLDYHTLKKYVKKEDGTIEIQDVGNYKLDDKNRVIEL